MYMYNYTELLEFYYALSKNEILKQVSSEVVFFFIHFVEVWGNYFIGRVKMCLPNTIADWLQKMYI